MTENIIFTFDSIGFEQTESKAVDYIVSFLKRDSKRTLLIKLYFPGGGPFWEREYISLTVKLFEYIVGEGINEERIDFVLVPDKEQRYMPGKKTQLVHFVFK